MEALRLVLLYAHLIGFALPAWPSTATAANAVVAVFWC